jgi:hypothetical protein
MLVAHQTARWLKSQFVEKVSFYELRSEQMIFLQL